MNGWAEAVLMGLACLCAASLGVCLSGAWLRRQALLDRRRQVRKRAGVVAAGLGESGGLVEVIARYLVKVSKGITGKTVKSFAQSFHLGSVSKRGAPIRSVYWFAEHAQKAGLSTEVTYVGFREAQLRLAFVCAAIGGVLGAALSNELACVLAVVGAGSGVAAPRWAVRSIEKRRTAQVERHLSEMLEVVSLGLRSGLSFDRSFDLYGTHFESPLAQACASAQRRWSLGLATREESLRALADSYASERFVRVVDNVVRSLRFGSSLAESLEAAANDARVEHRAHVEERVAKAPVKMMIPTGALILPAMLLLVLGPVLLELSAGF